jgi:acetyltransferase
MAIGNHDEVRGYEVLPDGTEIVIRPLHPEDRDLINEGFSLLGPDSRYQRYFTHKQSLGDDDLRFLEELDGGQQRAVGMAAWDDEGHERPIGIARYVRLAPGSDAAEAAITIVDTMHGKGLGKLLMRKLCEAAYRDGVRTFRARVLSDNIAAIRLMRWVDPDMRVLGYEPGAEELEVRLPAPRSYCVDAR